MTVQESSSPNPLLPGRQIGVIARFIATAGGAGYSPIAPGTCGTVVAIPLVYASKDLSIAAYIGIMLGIILLGSWAAELSDRIWGTHDNGRIVVDEVAGYFVTMLFVPRNHWMLLIAGFFMFRFFDIVKPPPVRQIDQKVGGGLGVVLDDVGAGIYGCVLMLALAHFGAQWLDLNL